MVRIVITTVSIVTFASLIDALYGGSYSRGITFFESKYISEIRPNSVKRVNSWLLQQVSNARPVLRLTIDIQCAKNNGLHGNISVVIKV